MSNFWLSSLVDRVQIPGRPRQLSDVFLFAAVFLPSLRLTVRLFGEIRSYSCSLCLCRSHLLLFLLPKLLLALLRRVTKKFFLKYLKRRVGVQVWPHSFLNSAPDGS